MSLEKIYQPSDGIMRIAIFMSGSGTNAIKIIDRSKKADSKFQVNLLFSDTKDSSRKGDGSKVCRAKDIAEKYSIPYEALDILDFYKEKGYKNKRNLSLRPEYDRNVLNLIDPYNIDLIALAGYMSIVTRPMLSKYESRITNVHPADLSIKCNGERKYKGLHAVRDAILCGEDELRSTTHIVRRDVDAGEILVRSKPIPVELPSDLTREDLLEDKRKLSRIVDEHQERLKREGDWIIYPLTLQWIAKGFFALKSKGNLFFKGELIPKGYTLG